MTHGRMRMGRPDLTNPPNYKVDTVYYELYYLRNMTVIRLSALLLPEIVSRTPLKRFQ